MYIVRWFYCRSQIYQQCIVCCFIFISRSHVKIPSPKRDVMVHGIIRSISWISRHTLDSPQDTISYQQPTIRYLSPAEMSQLSSIVSNTVVTQMPWT